MRLLIALLLLSTTVRADERADLIEIAQMEKHTGGWILGVSAGSYVAGVALAIDGLDHNRRNEAWGAVGALALGQIGLITGLVLYIQGGRHMSRLGSGPDGQRHTEQRAALAGLRLQSAAMSFDVAQ